MHKYRLTISSKATGTAYAVSVDVPGQGWTELISWEAARLGRGWRDEVATQATAHGWLIVPTAEWPTRRPAEVSIEVEPQSWETVLGQATDEHRRMQEAAQRHERAWHGLIADVPKTEVTVTDVSKITGFGRVWVTRIRNDNQTDPKER